MTDPELMDKYFLHELDEAERATFEQRMATDEAFRQEVHAHERALAAIRLDGLRDLKQRLQQREATFRQRKSRTRQGGLVTLSLLALLVAGWWFLKKDHTPQPPPPQIQVPPTVADSFEQRPFSPADTPHIEQKSPSNQNQEHPKPPVAQRKPNTQALFAAAFQPYRDASLNPTVRDKKNPAPFDRFLQAYWENKHGAALTAFENLDSALQESDDVRFLRANSLLATGQAAEAAVIFDNILAHNTSRFADQARWYLALCQLKKGELGKAKKQLETLVSDTNALHRDDALRLLEQLH